MDPKVTFPVQVKQTRIPDQIKYGKIIRVKILIVQDFLLGIQHADPIQVTVDPQIAGAGVTKDCIA
jgi:hypothetical protein